MQPSRVLNAGVKNDQAWQPGRCKRSFLLLVRHPHARSATTAKSAHPELRICLCRATVEYAQHKENRWMGWKSSKPWGIPSGCLGQCPTSTCGKDSHDDPQMSLHDESCRSGQGLVAIRAKGNKLKASTGKPSGVAWPLPARCRTVRKPPPESPP